MCVHTLTPRENRVRNIFKNSEKNTIFNEHPVPHLFFFVMFLFLWPGKGIRRIGINQLNISNLFLFFSFLQSMRVTFFASSCDSRLAPKILVNQNENALVLYFAMPLFLDLRKAFDYLY